ncbi:MAG TPA: 6-phosphogluconolactonase [Candidatus Angelobacter sp.]|jgi:6-phosphogluconolactonase|nr:6-phosphogluconolactonase [Candidatus Angelobacter sp.]
MGTQVKIVSDNATLARTAAGEFHRMAEAAIQERGRFSVALSGGNTPRTVYSLLASEHKQLPWNNIHIFFGDERHVPPEDPESNFLMASEALLSKVPIPEVNVHRIHAELDAEVAAAEYDQQLVNFFHLRNHDWPRFDLIFLGLGEDGHTASLFPASKALTESSRRVVANWVEKFQTFRITLTFPVLNNAAEVAFLVSGADKAQILNQVLRPGAQKYPAQSVQPENGRLLWLVDQDAGSLLPSAVPSTS